MKEGMDMFADRLKKEYLYKTELIEEPFLVIQGKDAEKVRNAFEELQTKKRTDLNTPANEQTSQKSKHAKTIEKMVADDTIGHHFKSTSVAPPETISAAAIRYKYIYDIYREEFDPETSMTNAQFTLLHDLWRKPARTGPRPLLEGLIAPEDSPALKTCAICDLSPPMMAIYEATMAAAKQSNGDKPLPLNPRLTHTQLSTIDGWLLDEVINIYIDAVGEACFPRKVVNFTTYALRTDLDKPSRVLKSKFLALSQVEIGLLPVNVNYTHWVLLVVEPATRLIYYFNSIGDQPIASSTQVQTLVRDLQAQDPGSGREEYQVKKGRSQQQTDGSACGVFTCITACCLCINFNPRRSFHQGHIEQLRRHIAAVVIEDSFFGNVGWTDEHFHDEKKSLEEILGA
ncbi:uncharacterized protein KY384_003512 [Bacidia gigantensis]|uniref:uncharacterized protein n=1 Tax=Bacidia gigantensis TaxID=2732470 RepID=UPI001D04309F|nr:uncharacterized protein KY384_003512 [Bacidia gigantensis]KAG8531876.1 hypothetical protein KY384_003512 [Bacidia gigantensis]